MAWKQDPPYQYQDADGRLSGLEIEVVQAAMTRLQCRLLTVELPFARSLAELEAGHVDLVPGVLPTPERERYARFSLPGVHTRNLIFLRSDLAPGRRVSTWDELRASDLQMGVERGVAYRTELMQRLARPGVERRLEEATSLEALLRMLKMQRIDAFVADEYSAAFLARQLGLGTAIQASPLEIDGEPPTFAFARRNVQAEFVERFNAALDALRRDGTLKRLQTRFLSSPPSPRR